MDQLPLFPEPELPKPHERSVEEMAAHIAAHSRPYESPDRTSEAARDQGWGPVTTIEAPDAQPPLKPRYEMPGQNRGRNQPYNQPASRADILKGMSKEDIAQQDAVNKIGAAAVRDEWGLMGQVRGH